MLDLAAMGLTRSALMAATWESMGPFTPFLALSFTLAIGFWLVRRIIGMLLWAFSFGPFNFGGGRTDASGGYGNVMVRGSGLTKRAASPPPSGAGSWRYDGSTWVSRSRGLGDLDLIGGTVGPRRSTRRKKRA